MSIHAVGTTTKRRFQKWRHQAGGCSHHSTLSVASFSQSLIPHLPCHYPGRIGFLQLSAWLWKNWGAIFTQIHLQSIHQHPEQKHELTKSHWGDMNYHDIRLRTPESGVLHPKALLFPASISLAASPPPPPGGAGFLPHLSAQLIGPLFRKLTCLAGRPTMNESMYDSY